jgi:hypothetical protein
MHVHINHCFCTKSNWNGGMYHCRYMVVIQRTLSYDVAAKEEKDWALLEKHRLFDPVRYDDLKELYEPKNLDTSRLKDISYTTTKRLKPTVFSWLVENVKDNARDEGKGFCVGTDEYNKDCCDSFTIFFYRRSDALNFITRWSVYKTPTTYFDYFREIRKEIDFKTMKLKLVDDFTLR